MSQDLSFRWLDVWIDICSYLRFAIGCWWCGFLERIMTIEIVDHKVNTRYGELCLRQQGPRGAPKVLVLGGISGGRLAYLADGSGWWQGLFTHLDLQAYEIWTLDYLGGMGDSLCDAPPATVEAQAEAIALALQKLGCTHWHTIIGGSFGGCVGMVLALHDALRVQRLAVLGAAHRPTAQAVMLRSLQRDFIELAAQTQQPERGVALARALAMVTYRGTTGLDVRFPDGNAAVHYMHDRAARLVQQNPQQARQLFTVFGPALDAFRIAPQALQLPVCVIGFKDDLLVPSHLLEEFSRQLPQCQAYEQVATAHGHDGFILNTAAFAPCLQQFMEA